VQNFINFFISTMFWLAFIPFHERLQPVFEANQSGSGSGFPDFVGTVDFNVTNIYRGPFSPGGDLIWQEND
jgi:hypothetical protein